MQNAQTRMIAPRAPGSAHHIQNYDLEDRTGGREWTYLVLGLWGCWKVGLWDAGLGMNGCVDDGWARWPPLQPPLNKTGTVKLRQTCKMETPWQYQSKDGRWDVEFWDHGDRQVSEKTVATRFEARDSKSLSLTAATATQTNSTRYTIPRQCSLINELVLSVLVELWIHPLICPVSFL